MPTQETEAKFLNVNLDEIRVKLSSIGANLVEPSMPVRRAIIETPEMRAKEAFVRVRDEGGKVTVAYKQHAKLELGGAVEILLPGDNIDFEGAVEYNRAILDTCSESYQETRRETWDLEGVMVTLDEWPWLSPFVEVEADTGEAVKSAAEKMGFNWQEAVFGGINIVYQKQYPHLDDKASITKLPVVRFDDPLPEMLRG